MDRRALERLGHHVVSRRVALGYRNRTDLADSLQFTVRTLADIEHGVRKASPGTYAMLENKLAWAPGSIDTILAGGEPRELVVKLRRTTHNRAVSRTPPTRYPVPPLKSCSWSCDGASSRPARHVKCGKTWAGLVNLFEVQWGIACWEVRVRSRCEVQAASDDLVMSFQVAKRSAISVR